MSAKLDHADHMLHTNAMAYGKENRELIEKLHLPRQLENARLAKIRRREEIAKLKRGTALTDEEYGMFSLEVGCGFIAAAPSHRLRQRGRAYPARGSRT